jgi:hypothetical protein
MTLFIFQLDISGSDINLEQPQNNSLILIALSVWKLEISGNDIKDEQ